MYNVCVYVCMHVRQYGVYYAFNTCVGFNRFNKREDSSSSLRCEHLELYRLNATQKCVRFNTIIFIDVHIVE